MERKAKPQPNLMAKPKNILKRSAYSAAIVLALVAGRAIATEYEIIKLAPPDPNCNFSGAESINNNGIVIGTFGESTGGSRPSTVWKKNFLYQDGNYKEFDLDQDYGIFFINDWGEVLANGGSGCDFYKLNEKIEATIGHGYTDFNNKGEAVSPQGYYFYGYLDCSDPGHCVSDAYLGLSCWGINDLSQITGYTTEGHTVYRPVVWEEHGEIIELERLPYNEDSSGLAINNLREVAGYYGEVACIWGAEGGIHIIEHNDCYPTWPEAINDKSQVVGLAYGLAGGEFGETAFLYDYNTNELVNLNDKISEDSGWERLKRAWDINNKGQIVGYGDYQENGERHIYAFLMNPIQKPKTLSADSDNDGIVNGVDLAEFGNQWLEREDWYEE